MSFFKKPITPVNDDDDKLVAGYRAHGDLAVLGKLYERHMHLVYGVCLKYLKDEEQSQDAVMAIFEELVTKVRQHEIKQFKSWLYVLSRNYCLMQLRAGKKIITVELEEFMEFDPIVHPEENGREESLNKLEHCMGKLTPAQKQSVQLFYLEERCYKDIAEVTGFTMNEVKSYIQNGKRNLKICLERNGG
ncbi:sigma-70 family RNA polymerase sigma factor [Mucilaginibacter terrenus]|uniref:Sigma-70 family RNA polymerase sigma factor n=1 Tax=Mucilaginibacter terrenus TaxID=2482727 RepID=A0A3E2NK04_9SPHI|nr:sigma-70 family RNA polymerase sigma factor [Mucilaginibacter terrenus]RFZ81253.1 sigma-70 family RNA polymerase sigma factor [Mucilaginibacter terrenus]